jgi:hypothetical protein
VCGVFIKIAISFPQVSYFFEIVCSGNSQHQPP